MARDTHDLQVVEVSTKNPGDGRGRLLSRALANVLEVQQVVVPLAAQDALPAEGVHGVDPSLTQGAPIAPRPRRQPYTAVCTALDTNSTSCLRISVLHGRVTRDSDSWVARGHLNSSPTG